MSQIYSQLRKQIYFFRIQKKVFEKKIHDFFQEQKDDFWKSTFENFQFSKVDFQKPYFSWKKIMDFFLENFFLDANLFFIFWGSWEKIWDIASM